MKMNTKKKIMKWLTVLLYCVIFVAVVVALVGVLDALAGFLCQLLFALIVCIGLGWIAIIIKELM